MMNLTKDKQQVFEHIEECSARTTPVASAVDTGKRTSGSTSRRGSPALQATSKPVTSMTDDDTSAVSSGRTRRTGTEEGDVPADVIDGGGVGAPEDAAGATANGLLAAGLGSDVKSNRGRGISLKMLMEEGIVEAGAGTLAIDYLGRKFLGDLLASGDIRWQENGEIFGSPSAWATHCKRIMNPDKKSGSRWASVKYKGRKLDLFKSMYLRNQLKANDECEGGNTTAAVVTSASSSPLKQVEEDCEIEVKKGRLKNEEQEVGLHAIESSECNNNNNNNNHNIGNCKKDSTRRVVLKHSTLGNRSSERDPNTLVECTPFCALGKIQPFTVTITTNCLILMDFHCHLTTSEIVGYLAGHWDVNAHNLAIEQAYPCKCRIGDKERAPIVEEEIQQSLEKRQMNLVGWYHSHPASPVHPTLRDIDCQMEYQIRLKGSSDASYTPCVGVICSPYERDCTSLESSIQAYWVMPPPENKPMEYGKPMLMTFSLIQENFLPESVKEEMLALTGFYKSAPDFVSFEKKWKDNVTYLEKLQKSLSQKAPLDQMESSVGEAIQSLLKPVLDTEDNGISVK